MEAHQRIVHIIAVPYDSGRRAERMGAGPLRLLEAGLAQRLEHAGRIVRVSIVETSHGLWPGEIAAAFDLARQAAVLVRAAIAEGTFPLVLSGNCGPAALGCVCGADDVSRVFWFDAHGDFNTPETTIGGFLDGMALATLTGRCWRELTASLAGFRAIPEASVTLIGARDLDPLEEKALAASQVGRISTGTVADLPTRLDTSRPVPSYVHFDLDVLDPSEAKMNCYAAPGGLSVPQARAALRAIWSGSLVRAASVTAFDPACDSSERALEAAVALASEIVELSGI
jgi:arginase